MKRFMIVKELNSGKMYREYSIEVPYKDVAKMIDNKINTILPNVELPGFRKGKAPLNIVKKKYENNILSEVIENIAKENTQKLLKEKNIKPLRQPKVEVTKYKIDSPLELKLKIDLEPDVKIIDFKKLKAKKYTIKIDKKTYDDNYNQYIKSQKTYEKLHNSRSAKMGDRININLSSKDESVPDFLNNQKNIPIYTDTDYQILPDLSNEIIKKKAKIGDIIKISFDIKEVLKIKNKKLAQFEIEILSIEEKKEVKIDKDFLNKNKLKSENDLKNKVNNNLKVYYDNLLKEIEKKQLYDLLESKHTFDIPEGVLEDEFNQIWKRVQQAKEKNSLDEDDKKLPDKQLEKRYQNIASRRVKLAILIQKIAEKKSINVTSEELSNGLLNYASQYPGQEKQIFEYIKKNPSQMEHIKGPIFENKVLESVLLDTIKDTQNIKVDEIQKLQEKTFSVKE